jgi:hypothetical protein
LSLTVKTTAEPALRGDSKRYVERHVRPFVRYGFAGELQIRRRLGATKDQTRVVEFESLLSGDVLRGPDWREKLAAVRQREHWRATGERENNDAAFRAAVAAALQRGTAKLRQQLQDIGSSGLKAEAKDAERSYNSGRLALGLLALVKGGVDKNDEVVRAGFAELRRRHLVDTYSLANAIMAIDALYAPTSEAGDLRSGALKSPRRREPSDGDRALLQGWADRLLTNTDQSVDTDQLLRFNYAGGHGFDHSVNQYGLLGLYAAHLCGIDIGGDIWEAAANHLIANQSSEGVKLELQLIDFKTLARAQAAPDEPATVSTSWNRANGWSYKEPKLDRELAPTWGSMTCAGIAGLTICQAALLERTQNRRPRLVAETSRARDDGFAWLAQWMTFRCHPGAIERQQRWYYYYLYSLERAALLSGVALIQDRDWYFEGAMMLVLAQNQDGGWPAELEYDAEIERNAMAILFLKQSTLPVLTGR